MLSFFIKHSGNEKKTQKSDISKNIIKNYKSLSLYDLCFSGAVVAYFQITILPNIIKQILKQLDVNVAILTTISIMMFIITCNTAARLFGLVLMVVLSLLIYIKQIMIYL